MTSGGTTSGRPALHLIDEFRDARLAAALAAEIAALAQADRSYRIMEVCGGHTHAIYRYGLDDLLPENIEFVHGPGCPVCVIPTGLVDDAIALALDNDVTLTCFGDMMRVPGARRTLTDARAAGADVRMVYSPLDALRIAREHPDRQVVFLAIGFETTAPSTALTLRRARHERLENFSVMCHHVLIEPPLRALLDSPDLQLDAFIGPGHVATVIGVRAFDFIPAEYRKPVVISGFEPLDLLQSTRMLVAQLRDGRAAAENQYSRTVTYEGNSAAQAVMAEVFAVRENFEWRGLGYIPNSGLRLADAYAEFDAERRFTVPGLRIPDRRACQCGEVLKGMIKPWECRVFGTACTPEHAIGTCMVSPEGACAAYYNYGRLARGPAGRTGVPARS